MFGPLLFGENSKPCACIMCENNFELPNELDKLLKHLFDTHNIVIEEPQNIAKLPNYLLHWKERLKESGVSVIPSVKVDESEEKYMVFSTLLKEDADLRHKLKLEKAIEMQDWERTAKEYNKMCLFCKFEMNGTCHEYIQHLSQEHNLQLGRPENLVYIAELISVVENQLESLICLYCEKAFPDRTVLKEHMRKKLHKRINPQNRIYDKYYIVNYLEPGKTWESIQKEDDTMPLYLRKSENASDEEWQDWTESEQDIVCLFCQSTDTEIRKLQSHMRQKHHFDFEKACQNLDFYQKVKLVNYIRRQVFLKRCPSCETAFQTRTDLEQHLGEEQHTFAIEKKIFDQPEYYFPTYEDDAFLCFLEEIVE